MVPYKIQSSGAEGCSKNICTINSVVNGFPVCGISFVLEEKNEILKEYLGTGFGKCYYFGLSYG